MLYILFCLFTSKRLLYLSFDDLAYCSERMIEHWTVGSEADTQGLLYCSVSLKSGMDSRKGP